MEEPIAFVQYNGVDMNGVSAKQFDFNLKITVKNNLFLPNVNSSRSLIMFQQLFHLQIRMDVTLADQCRHWLS